MNGDARELKRRLRGVQATEQVARAMKTVSVSKYNRVLAVSRGLDEYAEACRQMLASLGAPKPAPEAEKERSGVCYVVITGNRGLCGTYHIELFRALQGVIDGETRPVSLLLYGKWAQQNLGMLRGAEILGCEQMPDLPDFALAQEVTARMEKLYDSGLEEVSFLVQRFQNVLVQTPGKIPFLPERTESGQRQEYLYFPDEQTVRDSTLELCRTVSVYQVLLNCAKGVHGATLSAMRTASDNSTDMIRQLTEQLSRLRQTAATTEVIELSGAALGDTEGR